MLRAFINGWLFALGLLCLPAGAATISLLPTQASVRVGDELTVEIQLSKSANETGLAVGVFDLSLNFDDSVAAMSGVTFGNQLDVLGLGSVQSLASGAGYVDLFELSLDSPSELESLQRDVFSLATISFVVLAAGSFDLTLTLNALGDAFGNSVAADIFLSDVVASAQLSEPGGIGVVILVLIASVCAPWLRRTGVEVRLRSLVA